MKKTFVFCSQCVKDPNDVLFTCSADFDAYCANGHFFQPSQSRYDGRPEIIMRTCEVKRDETQDTIAEDRTRIFTGGDYDYFAWQRSTEERLQ